MKDLLKGHRFQSAEVTEMTEKRPAEVLPVMLRLMENV
jgi:hypothetical protein